MINSQTIEKIVFCVSVAISLVLSVVFTVYVNVKRKKYNVGFGKISGLYIYVSSVAMIDMSLIFSMDRILGITQRILTVVPVLMCVPLIYLRKILSEIIAKENVDLQYEFLVRKRESDEQYFDSMKEYMDRLSVFRHDFMNKIQLAYFMMEDNDTSAECKKLLDSMSEEIQSTRPAMYCSNRMVNIILTMCVKKTLNNNIRLNMDVIIPGKLEKEEILCSLINNMVEECMELTKISEDKKERVVDFSIKKKDERIIAILKMGINNIKNSEEYHRIMSMYDRYFNYVIKKCDGEVYCDEKNDALSIIAICNV